MRLRVVVEADLVLLNARVVTLDPACPRAAAVACGGGRVLLVGDAAQARALAGPGAECIDAGGGVVVPGFHDAHLHLLRYARAGAHLDLAGAEINTLSELQRALRQRASELPQGAWLRASGYDEQGLIERRHPDRHDLDAAVAARPVRLQHRSLHLDVLNSLALRLTGLWESRAAEVERDPDTGEATGRVYHGAELLHERLPRPTQVELAADVQRASERLLAWGITSFEDATATNTLDELRLFQRFAAQGALRQHAWLMLGAARLAQSPRTPDAHAPPPRGGLAGSGHGSDRSGLGEARVHLGHAKVMLNEATSEFADVLAQVRAARAAGFGVAVHAVSEAEVALALEALRAAGPAPAVPGRHGHAGRAWREASPRRTRAQHDPAGQGGPGDRIEHGGVIPDEWLPELRAFGVTVVGQPGLVYARGDVYQTEYPPGLHAWLHRAGSLLRAGVGYAIGSDGPLTQPWPSLALFGAIQRRTRAGNVLGPGEALSPEQALRAYTRGPLRQGAPADFVVLEPDGPLARLLDATAEPPRAPEPGPPRTPVPVPGPPSMPEPVPEPEAARLTVLDGRVVWRVL
jgi:predicted amidohydrolase YtcJ